jgi:diguanylate cyclase (GGDEF)-like protein
VQICEAGLTSLDLEVTVRVGPRPGWRPAALVPLDGVPDARARGRRSLQFLGGAVAALCAGAALVLQLISPTLALPAWTAAAVTGGAGPAGALTALAAGLVPVSLPARAALAVAALAARLVARTHDRRAEELSAQAFTDGLTGLYRHEYFEQALAHEIARARRHDEPLSLAVLDLDRFKAFNDRYGHGAGNDLLAQVGDAIATCVRESELAARYGGEEFVVLCHGDASDAGAAADRIRRAVAGIRIAVADGTAGTTISAGVAMHRQGSSPDDLFADADAALYQAKRRGRNRVVAARAGPAAQRARRRVA